MKHSNLSTSIFKVYNFQKWPTISEVIDITDLVTEDLEDIEDIKFSVFINVNHSH